MIEILTVIAITAVLAATLTPVLVKAKLKAKEANGLSNLRQCSLGLLLYSDQYGGEQYMPQYAEATKVLEKAPTCDLNDYWRMGCKQGVVMPLIGSYGYVRGTTLGDTEANWSEYLADENLGKNLLICPFYGSAHLHEFKGDMDLGCGPPIEGCRYPDHILAARLDGSVVARNNHYGGTVETGGFNFTWSSAFTVRY